MSIETVLRLINRSMSTDLATMKNATDKLVQCQKRNGFSNILLELLSLEFRNEHEIQLAAAINLKNLIRKYWAGNNDDDLYDIPEDDRNNIKMNLIILMIDSTSRKAQRQLAQCASMIASVDFPHGWPDMLPLMIGRMNLKVPSTIFAVFVALDEIFVKYQNEYKSQKLWNEIAKVLELFATTYFEAYKEIILQLSNFAGLDDEERKMIATIVACSVRIFISLTSQELADHFAENLQAYLEGFAFILNFVPPPDSDDGTCVLLDESKICVCKALSVLAMDYTDDFEPYSLEFMKNVWTMLIALENVEADALKCAGMQYLAKVVTAGDRSSAMSNESDLAAICERIIIPNIVIREQDIDAYEDNPDDYIKRDIGRFDNETLRQYAGDLIRALCLKYEVQVVNVFGQYIQTLLQKYSQDVESNWKHQDAATFLVIAMATREKTEKHGATAVSELIDFQTFFEQTLQSHLSDPNVHHLPILKADAIRYLTVFRSRFPKQKLIDNIPNLLHLIDSHNYAVCSYACYAIERFLVMEANQQLLLSSQDMVPFYPKLLHSLLDALLSCGIENDLAMKALMRICTAYPDLLMQKESVELIRTKLVDVIRAVSANPRKPLFNHHAFETLAIVNQHLGEKCKTPDQVEVFRNFQLTLNPLLEMIINKDISDFIPYAFQLWSVMVKAMTPILHGKEEEILVNSIYSRAITACTASLVDVTCNLSALVKLLAALAKHNSSWLLPRSEKELLGLVRKSFQSKIRDREGFVLLRILAFYSDRELHSTYLKEIFGAIFERLTKAKTIRFVHEVIRYISLLIVLYGSVAVGNLIDGFQPDMMRMVIQSLYLNELDRVRADQKIVIVATTMMLETYEPLFNGKYKDLWKPLCQSLYSLCKNMIDVGEKSKTGYTSLTNKGIDIDEVLLDEHVASNQLETCPLPVVEALPNIKEPREFFRTEITKFISEANFKGLDSDLISQAKSMFAMC